MKPYTSHSNNCPYCLLSAQVRMEYEWARDVHERIRASNDPRDHREAAEVRRKVNLLWKFVERMDNKLDAMHERER